MNAQEFDFSRRIPQLDGLRGLAILLVLCFHYYADALDHLAGMWPRLLLPLKIGWCGVDLFFVLSGFLIGGILLDARSSPSYFRTFYTRRVCRISPLYFAFLALAGVCYALLHWKESIPWWCYAFFLQNIWASFHGAQISALTPTWSLAVEEQFYLTLPTLIFLTKPKQVPKLLLGGILGAVLTRLAFLFFMRNPGVAIYTLLPCRMDSLLIGVGTAWLLRQPGASGFVRSHLKRIWLAMELLTVASATFFLFPSAASLLTVLVVYDSLALLFACLIVASLVDRRLVRILTQRWLMRLGSIAYGVYLLHELVWRVVAKIVPGLGSAWVGIVAIATTICLARISWEYFEKPIVKLGHRAMYVNHPERSIAIGPAVTVD